MTTRVHQLVLLLARLIVKQHGAAACSSPSQSTGGAGTAVLGAIRTIGRESACRKWHRRT